jgi:pimeloyl-ACP methyl ester carboxylesterase
MIEGFASHVAEVNGTTLHYVAGGQGDPLILLHGWPETWYAWHRVMPGLASRRRVIAVDLRGIGGSGKPSTGYDKKTMARDVYELIRHLGYARADVAGHDIGSMVAFSLAVNHPSAVRRLVMSEVQHPDEGFYSFSALPRPGMPNLWWFGLNNVPDFPEQLIRGRARVLIDHILDQQAADPTVISEEARRTLASAYDEPGAISASNRWYQAFGQDIEDIQTYGKVTVPVLGLGGLYGEAMRGAVAEKALDFRYVQIPDAGHHLALENPDAVVRAVDDFLQET